MHAVGQHAVSRQRRRHLLRVGLALAGETILLLLRRRGWDRHQHIELDIGLARLRRRDGVGQRRPEVGIQIVEPDLMLACMILSSVPGRIWLCASGGASL